MEVFIGFVDFRLGLVFKITGSIIPAFRQKCVTKPADRLITNVATSRQTDKLNPTDETLSIKISGSMDGDAIQNDMTGAKGTPPISMEATTGITPHEQNGLTAPTIVANKMET